MSSCRRLDGEGEGRADGVEVCGEGVAGVGDPGHVGVEAAPDGEGGIECLEFQVPQGQVHIARAVLGQGTVATSGAIPVRAGLEDAGDPLLGLPAVVRADEHARHFAPDGLIPYTGAEIPELLALAPTRRPPPHNGRVAHGLRRSHPRRQHQAVSNGGHRRRRTSEPALKRD